MQGQIRATDDCVEILMTGAMRFTVHREFGDLLETARSKNKGSCVIDLAGITEIDSAGIGMLLLAYDQSEKEKKQLSLRNPTESVRKILEHCKIHQLIPIV